MTDGKHAEVERYIASFPPDAAFILERLRETVHKAAPEKRERLFYGHFGVETSLEVADDAPATSAQKSKPKLWPYLRQKWVAPQIRPRQRP